MNKLEKDLLFYSNYCMHSNNLINDLAKTPLHNKMLYICIDDKKIKIPNFITRVPTIYLVKQRKVLIENEIDEWINFNLRQLSGNSNYQNIPSNIQMPQQQMQQQQMQQQHMPQQHMPQQQMPQQHMPQQHMQQQQMQQQQMQQQQMQQQQMQQQQMQQQQHMPQQQQMVSSKKEEETGDISAYHGNEMGSDLSTFYSFIEEENNSSLNHNFSFIDNPNNNSNNNSINTPKEFNSNNNEDKQKSQTDLAYDKLMESRNNDPISKGIQRI